MTELINSAPDRPPFFIEFDSLLKALQEFRSPAPLEVLSDGFVLVPDPPDVEHRLGEPQVYAKGFPSALRGGIIRPTEAVS